MQCPEHPLDVICLAKRYVTNVELNQAPFVVLYHSMLMKLPTVFELRAPNPPKHPDEWLTIAKLWLDLHLNDPGVQGAVRYLLALSRGEVAHGCLAPLPWHEERSVPDELLQFIAGAYKPVVLSSMLPAAVCRVTVRGR